MEFFTFDDDYVRRLREGDRWTEEHFRSYFSELLFIKLRHRVRTIDEIDDLLQEVLLRVFRTIREDGLRDGRSLGAFVNAVCENLLRERYRPRQRVDQLDETHTEIAASDPDALKTLMRKEKAERVRRLLDDLEPRRDAEILREVFLEEQDKDEICRRHGVDRAYLRVLVHRARKRFRSEYAGPNLVPFKSDETKSKESSLEPTKNDGT